VVVHFSAEPTRRATQTVITSAVKAGSRYGAHRFQNTARAIVESVPLQSMAVLFTPEATKARRLGGRT
jgi:hypothetical protein